MSRSALAALLALLTAAPAAAQWPTTDWTVLDEATGYEAPEGDRAALATKHVGILRGASRWFESLRFPRPLQRTPDDDLDVDGGEPYLAFLKADASGIGSSHGSTGYMKLTSHPGFLTTGTQTWELMEASAVHELYHGIQKGSSPSLVRRMESRPPELGGCPGDTDLDWLVEGTAAMVQIRWLEGQHGAWGHPFAGSTRAAWVREFDQPLVRGTLPGDELMSHEPVAPDMTSMETVSWACDYGTWYFWYAAGDMIGRTPAEKVSYTQFLFNGVEPWDDGGVANADIGLRAAAAQYDAIGPYRGGLYDLYPEFVAQYLTEGRFYGALEEVELAAPGLYETDAAASGGPLGPLASRAWRVRVQLPPNASPIPYNVRFTLEAEGGTDRDDLHLIVDRDVAGRPAEASTPYTAVERTDAHPSVDDGAVEYLVRVANVAEAATDTEEAAFRLRVEVDGFYGEDVGDGGALAGAVGGELPPGFAVNGPAGWACRSGSQPRAVFDLMTPDELGQDVERALPEFAQDMEDMMDDMEIAMRRAEQMGRDTGALRAQIAEARERARAEMARAQAQHQGEIDQAAAEVRGERTTTLGATFVGQEAGAECQMTLGATLQGREGGAQILPGAVDRDLYPEDEAPGFGIMVFPQALLDRMSGMGAMMAEVEPGTIPAGLAQMEDPMDGWQVCTMTDEERRRARESAGDCPAVTCTAGQLVLEEAAQGRIAGSFQFEVIKWPDEQTGRCRVPSGRDVVTGHFNVASTDDGTDDNSLSGFGLGGLMNGGGGVPIVPGAPILNLDLGGDE